MTTPPSSVGSDADRFLLHVRALRPVVEHLRDGGWSPADVQDLLAKHALADADIEAYSGFVSINRFAHLLHELAAVEQEPALGLLLGDKTQATSLGVLGQAFATAPNLERALEILALSMKLYADVTHSSFAVSDERAEFTWAYSPLLMRIDELCDRAARLFVQSIQHLFFAGLVPVEVHLQRRLPADPAPYRKMLAPVVLFDRPVNSVVLRTADLDRPSLVANEASHEAALELVKRMTAERRVPDDLSVRVREDILGSLSDPMQGIEQTAARMAMSPRVLQRRLEALGTTYQALSNELRQAMAEELLLNTDLPMGEIAFRLGFSNQANLTRAVKRWFGTSPSAVRARGSSGVPPQQAD
ncbi:MAG: AraC family transcriptional regulator ligand-binding domain-containing protein [Devosiaceae bacterium]|nr:AraC family transcriptional regulator ligand-binding domain-containing protein [Devosiaceae bacterium MH13]